MIIAFFWFLLIKYNMINNKTNLLEFELLEFEYSCTFEC